MYREAMRRRIYRFKDMGCRSGYVRETSSVTTSDTCKVPSVSHKLEQVTRKGGKTSIGGGTSRVQWNSQWLDTNPEKVSF